MHVANDLAGKSNPIDRIPSTILGDERGRKAVNALSLVSNRMRANAVVGNINTMIAQFFNMPNVVGYAKNPIALEKGYRTALKAYVGDRKAQELLNKSMFLNERYLDRSFRRFDTGIDGRLNNALSLSLELGDKIVADGAWITFYNQSIKKGLSEMDAILKADEMTRKAIAGRGIGEMPISQKAKLTKLFAPFQVEVRNAINVLEDLGVQGDAIGILVGVFGTSFLMNTALEATTGRQIGLNPYGIAYEAIKNDEMKNLPLRMAGHVMTNYPGGSYFADVIKNSLNLADYDMSHIFGSEDPSRFGTGNIAIQTLGEPIGQALKQKVHEQDKTSINLLKPLSATLPKYGGKQIERSIRGLQDMNVLPREKVNVNSGVSLEKKPIPGSYSATGRLRFPLEETPANYMIAPTLGTWGTREGKEYLQKGRKVLGEKQTETVERSSNSLETYQKTVYQREIDSIDRKIKVIKKDEELTKEQKNKKMVQSLREKVKVVKDTDVLTDKEKSKKILDLQGEILKYQKN